MQQELPMVPLMMELGYRPNGVGVPPAYAAQRANFEWFFDTASKGRHAVAHVAVAGTDSRHDIVLYVHRRLARQRERFRAAHGRIMPGDWRQRSSAAA